MKYRVSDTIHTIGDRSGEFAKSIGDRTAHLARRFGDNTVDVARQVGPRRALIGAAIAVVAIGGTIMLVRYLQARRSRNDLGIGREEAVGGLGSRTNERVRSSGVEGGLSY